MIAELCGIRAFTKTDFVKARTRRIIEENAAFVGRPDGIGAAKSRALELEEESARLAAPRDHRLSQEGLFDVEPVAFAENLTNKTPQLR